MRRSCTDCRNRLTPGTFASFGRSRAITWSELTLRSSKGFSVIHMLPALVPPPPHPPAPVLALRPSTAGSSMTILTTCRMRSFIA